MRRWIWIAVMTGLFGLPVFLRAEHDPTSGFEWALGPDESVRAALFARGFFCCDESADVQPSKSNTRVLHSEGLLVQARPFELPVETLAKITLETHFDKPDLLRISGAVSAPPFLAAENLLRMRLGYIWESNIGNSADPPRGIEGLFADISARIYDEKPLRGVSRMSVFARYYLNSDIPLGRVSDERDNAEALRSEIGFEFRRSIFWPQFRVWAEPSVGFSGDFSEGQLVPEGGLEYEIPWRRGAFTLQFGVRHIRPFGNGYRPETAGWGGAILKFK